MTDLFCGDRVGRVRDPLGNIWWIQTKVDGLTTEEMQKRATDDGGMEPQPETHSPEYAGRAIVHLAADHAAFELSGEGFQVATLARRYGFVDVDGRTFERFLMPEENRLQQR